jgi:hypothetical protein
LNKLEPKKKANPKKKGQEKAREKNKNPNAVISANV